MVYYDTESRLQLAREHADGLVAEMRRSRRLTAEEAEITSWIRWGLALARRVERVIRHRGDRVPAYGI